MVSKKIYLLIFAVFLFALLLNSGNKTVDSVVYDICASMSDEEISHDDFEILLEAMHNNQCNEAWNVRTTFSMSKKDFDKIANTYAIIDSDGNPLVFYRTGSPSAIGAGAILVYGNSGDFPVKLGDRLHIWTSGDPKDIIIELADPGCDPYDNDCDAACSFEENDVCDPKCYVHNARENVPCDIDCVDKNSNNIIDAGDLDGICDKDCYNKDLDPFHAYDPDCVGTEPFCDPDTQGVRDGICDTKCAPKNKICDFDCNGTVYNPGNPSGLKDPDCYECDGTCNNFCSYFCTGIDHDPDCPGGFKDWFKLAGCCGDGTCGLNENCKLCPQDCTSSTSDVAEGGPCVCTPECGAGLVCNGPGTNLHCCPSGKEWNGTDCAVANYFDLVFVALAWEPTEDFEFRASARIALNDFMAKSPFKDCPDPERRVKVHYIDPANCPASACTDHCTDCITKAMQCIANNNLAGIVDKFAAITKGSSLSGNLGCAGGIPSDGVSTSSGKPEVTTHELGHALGLYHINVCGAPNQATDCPCACTTCQPAGTCLGPNALDCNEPDRYKFVMDYCNPMDHFGPKAYTFLKTQYNAGPPSSGLSKWLNGC